MTRRNLKHVDDLLKQRYFFQEETWEELCERVAKTVSMAEKTREKRNYWYKKFYDALVNKHFLPNSPVLWGAGIPKQTLSACFVIGIEDNIRGIMETLSRTVAIFKAGGGVGINFSNLRPSGLDISAGGKSSGPIAFLELFDTAGEVIKQGGRRRSAQMSVLNCDHPDIINFINAKSTPGKFTNMNLSVAVTNEFMEAVELGELWELKYNNYSKYIKAREIFNLICQRAWENGDPGILFLDRINEDNQCPNLGEITTTNPCWSEDTEVLYTKDLNENKDYWTFKELYELQKERKLYLWSYNFKRNIQIPKEMKNIRITSEKAELLKITFEDGSYIKCTPNHNFYKNKKGDKIEASELVSGNKIMGRMWKKPIINIVERIEKLEGEHVVYNATVENTHNYYVKPFNAKGNLILSSNCGEQPIRISESCSLASINLDHIVMEDGSTNLSLLGDLIETVTRFLDNTIDVNYFPDDIIDNAVKRVRPIGLGIMGLADYFIKKGIKYGSEDSRKELESILKFIKTTAESVSFELGKEKGSFPYHKQSKWSDKEYMRNSQLLSIAPTGSISKIADCSPGIEPIFTFATESRPIAGAKENMVIPSKWGKFEGDKSILVTGEELSWQEHLEMLAVAQKYVDTGISKTIALPHETTVEEVQEIFMMAWREGCKGMTVFRKDNGNRESLIKELCPHHNVELIRDGRCYICPVCGWSNRCSL